MKRAVALAVAVILAGTSVAQAAPINLLSHRAQYDVTLASTRPGGVVAMHGRTVLEFRDVCTGWTTTQRFISDMSDAKGNDVHAAL